MAPKWPTTLYTALSLTLPSLAIPTLTWTPCTANASYDCTTLTVPLECANPSKNDTATIPLARYASTSHPSHYKGSLLTNPGGPGSSGIDFLLAGAGSAISAITDGTYDIISWDPRGVGSAKPLLTCFDTIGEETTATGAVPLAAEIEYSQFSNESYMPEYFAKLREYDSAVGTLAESCAEYNSPALYTSSAAYVVRDMLAIIDAVSETEGVAKLNYWGLSYGTILGAEFIQTFPSRVGKVVLDGVFDAEANAKQYTSQLPNDQVSVHDAINDFAKLCEEAGRERCALATGSASSSNSSGTSNSTQNGNSTNPPAPQVPESTIPARLANLQASLYHNPIPVTDSTGTWPITPGIFSFFLYSFLKLPPAYPIVSTALSQLEKGNATLFASLLTGATTSTVINETAPATGSISGWPIQCTDNAPSNSTSLTEIANLVLDISQEQKTPWLNADLSTLSFCRNFPNRRPSLANLGASKLISGETNALLARSNSSILILNPEDDPTTPVRSAERLHSLLPDSSILVVREGPGHTSVSFGSLGVVERVRGYFLGLELDGSADGLHGNGNGGVREVYEVSQDIFAAAGGGGGGGIESVSMVPDPVFKAGDGGELSERERGLLESMYIIYKAFVGLP